MKLLPLFITFFIFALGCNNTPAPVKWKSKERKVEFTYADPWTLLPSLDSKAKTLTGVIDNKDGKSYIIHVTDDSPKDQLSDSAYFNSVKKTMLAPNPQNKFISAEDVTFHGQTFHKQVFMMYTDKWGLLKQVNFVRRTGKEFYSVQILFPVTEDDSYGAPIPRVLIDFDKGVLLD